jgi:hypothetical protein
LNHRFDKPWQNVVRREAGPMPVGIKSLLVTMLLAMLVVSCDSSLNKDRTYYTNRHSFGCYSAADLEEAVKLLNSGQADLFWLKLRKADDSECLELKPGFEVCILEEGPGDKIRIGACGEKDGLWAQRTSISKTLEQALSMPNMLPAPPQTGASAEGGAEKKRERLISRSLSEGKVSIGMSKDQVEQIWGKPELERKVILITNGGKSSGIEWSYSDGASVIFLNGEVTRLKSTGARRIGK